MAETGRLSERSVAEIFRDMARGGRGGILRVNQGRAIKVICFENGQAVFGLSNVPEDQLDVLLVRQRKLTPEQATRAKSQIKKEAEFGRKLVELNVLDR